MNERFINYIERLSLFVIVLSSSYIIYVFYLFQLSNSSHNQDSVSCGHNHSHLYKIDIENKINSINTTNGVSIDSIYIVADTIYNSVNKDYIETILKMDSTDGLLYKNEVFDCDEFGLLLLTNMIQISMLCLHNYRIAFGIITGYDKINQENHLLNFFIDHNLIFWCVEPQTDEIFLCDNGKFEFNFLLI